MLSIFDDVPEPFATALKIGRPGDVADAPANTAAEHHGRGLARMQLGRDQDARPDFERAGFGLMQRLEDAGGPAIDGDRCLIELAYLDIRRGATERALDQATSICGRAPKQGPLLPRAWHIRGLALGKLRRTQLPADAATDAPLLRGQPPALQALLDAAKLYSEQKLYDGLAQVHDTLGTLFMAEGELEVAAGHYAQSLAEKSLTGDRLGIAMTLGGLGRLHLRAGRWSDALECFVLDLEMSKEAGDELGQTQMLNDIARAHIGLGEYELAIARLEACLSRLEGADRDVAVCFASKDYAVALLRMHRAGRGSRTTGGDLLDRATQQLDFAEPLARSRYHEFLLRAARGELLTQQQGQFAAGARLLQEAAEGLLEIDLADVAIESLLLLAELWAERGEAGHAEAERHLRRADSLAERSGHTRFRRRVAEIRAAHGVRGLIHDADGRVDLQQPDRETIGGYARLSALGSGGFGSVWRAWDTLYGVEGEYVAIKVLRLDELYGPERTLVEASLRTELEVAARIRHDGVNRVLAVGRDKTGRTYVVSEFIDGPTLRQVMTTEGTRDGVRVLRVVGDIVRSLAHLHDNPDGRVHHLDLKPENVMIRYKTGKPVLIDFGIAQFPEKQSRELVIRACTPGYAAPEQYQGGPVGSGADVFAVGVILAEWLAGALPADEDVGSAERLQSRLEVLPAAIRAPVAGLIAAMTAAESRQRPPARVVAEAIAGLLPPVGG